MSRGQYRAPRRRGFDDDNYSPREMREERSRKPVSSGPAPMSAGPSTEATVKWFNATKGFGFVELADGSGDAFLHVAVLQSAGHEAVEPGAKLRVQVGQGPKGPQITAVLEVDTSGVAAPQPRTSGGRSGPGARHGGDPSTAAEMAGTVKWFNPDKGFGFVSVQDGGKDVFLHISVLEKAGLRELAEGQAVIMRVVDSQKGREAISVNLAD